MDSRCSDVGTYDQALSSSSPAAQAAPLTRSAIVAVRVLAGVLGSLGSMLRPTADGGSADGNAEAVHAVEPVLDSPGEPRGFDGDGSPVVLPLQLFCSILQRFAHCFSRKRAFLRFVLVIVGFVVAGDHLGVSSFVRWLQLPPSYYPLLLHVFRSTAWKLEVLLQSWCRQVSQEAPLLEVNGRVVFAGDHTIVPKEGIRMPGVRTAHQDSETSSKPSFLRAHVWGVLAALCAVGEHVRAIPLAAQIHQGREILGEPQEEDRRLSMTTRMVLMAVRAAEAANVLCYLVLDAFFGTGPTFDAANTHQVSEGGDPYVHVITRMKDNYVGWATPHEIRLPRKGKGRRRGPNRKYGARLKIEDQFEIWDDAFSTVTMRLYDKEEEVRYLCMNLLWKPIGRALRFVFIDGSRGRIILACSDLDLDPLTILQLYSWRIWIEVLISVLKNVMGVMSYRFWTKSAEREKRRPQKNTATHPPNSDHAKRKIRETWTAIERFVNLGMIATGLVQILSLRYGGTTWSADQVWLRTYSSDLPSEYVSKILLRDAILRNTAGVRPEGTLRELAHLRAEASLAQLSAHPPYPENL